MARVGNWQALEERNNSNVLTVQYTCSIAFVAAMSTRDRDTGTDGITDERLFVLQDANWNVTGLIDSTGAVVQRFQYDAYGARKLLTAAWATTGTNTYTFQHGMVGGKTNTVTGRVHFRARDYDVDLQRWLNPDSIGFQAGDMNFYQYVSVRPIIATDPSGEIAAFTALVGGAAGAGIGAANAYFGGGSLSDIGYGALRGGTGGLVIGGTLGFGGAGLSALAGGGVLGGIFAGAFASALGEFISQFLDQALAKSCEHDFDEIALAGAIGGLFGAFGLRPSNASIQQSTSWASKGIVPDLASNRWVMVGGQTVRNFVFTIGPAVSGKVPFSNAISGVVPGASLVYPPGLTGNLAGLLGQRILVGAK